MDRELLLAHLRNTRFAPGDRKRAQADARRIAGYLASTYDARVYGIGSAFDESRRFREHSDIDLVVDGLPAESYFTASVRVAKMTDFSLDLIPLEDATDAFLRVVEESGVRL